MQWPSCSVSENGIQDEEVERVQAGLEVVAHHAGRNRRRPALGTLASDWHFLGSGGSFDEIQGAVNGLTPANIVSHIREHRARDFTTVTLGPKELTR